MPLAAYAAKSAEPESVTYEGRFVGGTAAITEVTGTLSGVTTAFVSTGRVRFTFPDNPGTFIGATCTFHATTPADVKLYVGVFGAYPTSASTYTLDLYMYESGTLTDLAALEWASVVLSFKRTGVAG